MNGREFWALRDVSDERLEAGLYGLLGAGARVEARIVAHLAEVDARRLHLLLGCSSLYDYCRKRLGLSEYEAFARIAAARVAQKYPVVFEMLERRELHLTAICEVREFLTTENHRELLAEVSGRTKLQIREVLARRFPQADLPSSVKKLPALEPLSPGRYRLLITISADQKAKLELARDLLSHANPSGDLAIVLERALDELISRLEKRRFGRLARTVDLGLRRTNTTSRGQVGSAGGEITRTELASARSEPRETRRGEPTEQCTRGTRLDQRQIKHGETQHGETQHGDSQHGETQHGEHRPVVSRAGRQHIRNETRRQVLERDGCGCAFVGGEGQRCGARGFLQFHHQRAWARGGRDSADNLQVLCQAHNRLLAERDFGRSHIERAITDDARKVEQTLASANSNERRDS